MERKKVKKVKDGQLIRIRSIIKEEMKKYEYKIVSIERNEIIKRLIRIQSMIQ